MQDKEPSVALGENNPKGPRVAIIVLNWNNYEDTVECLESLKNVKYPNFHVIVVDNGSTDGSGERLAEEFEFPEFIFNGENKGFAAGNNIGITRALERGYDYILLLNNDTTVNDDFLTPLVKTAEFNERVAIVGGIIYEMDSNNIWFAGGRFNPTLVRGNHMTTVMDDDPYSTEWVTGAMMLLSSEFLRNVGGLNEDYFFGMEDIDISIKARKQGWNVVISPESRIYHKIGATSGVSSPFKYYHATWNRLNFASSNPIYMKYFFYLFFFITRILRILQWAIIQDRALSRTKAVINGIYDYLSNRPPSY